MGGRGDHRAQRELDVRDGPAVLAAVAAARPDVVVHTAYRLDDPSVNVEGTRAVAAAAVAAQARGWSTSPATSSSPAPGRGR